MTAAAVDSGDWWRVAHVLSCTSLLLEDLLFPAGPDIQFKCTGMDIREPRLIVGSWSALL